ncbi:Glycosyltransferase_GTB-type domain containing protein [Candidatus Nanopelagicaceae bacterium]
MQEYVPDAFSRFVVETIRKLDIRNLNTNLSPNSHLVIQIKQICSSLQYELSIQYIKRDFLTKRDLVIDNPNDTLILLDTKDLQKKKNASQLDYCASNSVGVLVISKLESINYFLEATPFNTKPLIRGIFDDINSKSKVKKKLEFGFIKGKYFGKKKINRSEELSVLCLMTVFNEKALIRDAIDHALDHGMDIHVIDNWSNDGTWELILQNYSKNSKVSFERFPSIDTKTFNLRSLLEHCEYVANRSKYNWIVRLDADERVNVLNAELNLNDYISIVDESGYDVIDFTVLEFRPTGVDKEYSSTYPVHGYFIGLKSHQNINRAWKNTPGGRFFSSTGGHIIEGSKQVFPFNVLLRHYSMQNPDHARRKLFLERIPRYDRGELAGGWHHHYDHFLENQSFSWEPKDLILWKDISPAIHFGEIAHRIGNIENQEPKMLNLVEASKMENRNFKSSVLLCVFDLFDSIPNGGGSSYKKVVEENQHIVFYSFKTNSTTSTSRLLNLIEIQVAPWRKSYNVLENIFEAVARCEFDYIDIPDWVAPESSLRDMLDRHDIKYKKIVGALHGSMSKILLARPKKYQNPTSIELFQVREKILYDEADFFYGFSKYYAETLGVSRRFKEISAVSMCDTLALEDDFQFASSITPVFVGRKEFTKGFDLFLDTLDSNKEFLPALIMAPTAFSDEEMQIMHERQMKSNSRIFSDQIVSKDEIYKISAVSNNLFFFPSRFDSFNLTFLEVLMNGAVTVVSKNVYARKMVDELGFNYLDFENFKFDKNLPLKMHEIKSKNIALIKKLKPGNKKDSSLGGIYEI